MLLLSATAVVLGVFVLEPAYHFFRNWKGAGQEEMYELEKEFYLASTIVLIIFVIRLFSIPLYFWTLQGLVPMIPGAMCLWGVFNAQPTLCWTSLFIKFTLPALYMGWIIVYGVNNLCKRNPLMRGLILLFLAFFPLLILDSVVDLSIFLSLNPIHVVCCTNAIDTWPKVIPSVIGGIHGQYLLLLVFYSFGILFSALVNYSMKFNKLLFLAHFISPLLLTLTIFTISEVFTPVILHTPFHFCPFCLFSEAPFSILFLIFFWISISSLWWPLITGIISRSDSSAQQIEANIRKKILTLSSFSMIISLIIISLLLVFSIMK